MARNARIGLSFSRVFGPNRNAPVTLTITSFPGQGVLGDLFCSLSGGPQP